MSDWAAAAKGAVGFTAQVGGSLLRLAKAIGNFNYQFISAVFTLLGEAWSAMCVFGMALGNASCEIVVYAFEFLVEFGRFLHVLLRLLTQLVIALLQIALWMYRILEQIVIIFANILLHCFRSMGAVLNNLLDYLGVYACRWASSLKSVTYAWFIWSISASNYVIECLKSIIEVSWNYIYHGLSVLYLFLEDCMQQVYCSCVNVLRTVDAELNRMWKISWSYIDTSIPKLVSVFSSQDVYLTIALIISVFILLQIIVIVLRNNGLTVPFFGQSRVTRSMNRRIILNWENTNDGLIFVSDEEGDEPTDNEEESDHDSVQTSTNTSQTNDNTSDVGETSEESSASFTDEFEIADDSDFESGDENDQNAINIQLPQHSVQYGLRPRVTPSPALSFTKLSQNELEKYLENERDKRLCVVCQDNPKNVLVLPCKHMCMCVTCARYLVTANRTRRVCPLCRSRIDTVMDVFL